MQETKTINSSDIMNKKILQELEKGTDIAEFIVSYINEKTYKSFRTFSKRLKETIKQLYNDKIINDDDLKKIEEAIFIKTKFREPEIIFKLAPFIKDMKEYFEFTKHNKKNLVNWFFLSTPFLLNYGLKEIKEMKYKEIKLHNFPNCLVIEYTSSDSNMPTCMKMNVLYKEWEELYNYFKEDKNEDDFIFDYFPSTHHHLNVLLDSSLRKYVKDITSPFRYYTIVKNAIKYSKDSFVAVL